MPRTLRVTLSFVVALLVTALVAPFARGSGVSNPGGGLSLPYAGSANSSSSAFKVTQAGSGEGIESAASNGGGAPFTATLNTGFAGTAAYRVVDKDHGGNKWFDARLDTETVPRFAVHDTGTGGMIALSEGTTVFDVTFEDDGAHACKFTATAGFYPSAAVPLGKANTGWSQVFVDYTNTATVGNVTIDKASGRVNIGAGLGLVTVTDNKVTAKSHVFLNADSAPGNVVAVMFYAVAGAGSFTVNAVPAVTNQTAVDFFVVNAD